jgi:hypothetical protein
MRTRLLPPALGVLPLLVPAVGLCLGVGAAPSRAQEIVVIVNAANPVESLSVDEVRQYCLKRRSTWSNGESVRPIDRTGDPPERLAFLSEALRLSSADVERHWIQEQYASAEITPTRVPDDVMVIRLVETFPGAIGFVTRETLDESAEAGVRPVLRFHGAAGRRAQAVRSPPARTNALSSRSDVTGQAAPGR